MQAEGYVETSCLGVYVNHLVVIPASNKSRTGQIRRVTSRGGLVLADASLG
jgi:hypothetical protein